MARWEPNTRERLIRAALDLYTTQGYDVTTVGDIADRVGVTSRTYFRYFPDKREVLFANPELNAAIVDGTRDAAADLSPFDAILAGIVASEPVFQDREFVRARAAVIGTSEPLRERELAKIATLGNALRTALVARGADPMAAQLAAAAGVVVFADSSARWLDDEQTPHADLVHSAAEDLRAAVSV